MEERITGMMIYYHFVCKRKLWYFCHEINMENENEDVMLGKLLDEGGYCLVLLEKDTAGKDYISIEWERRQRVCYIRI